jgi:hypothetical protein
MLPKRAVTAVNQFRHGLIRTNFIENRERHACAGKSAPAKNPSRVLDLDCSEHCLDFPHHVILDGSKAHAFRVSAPGAKG